MTQDSPNLLFRHLYVHVPFCRRRCSYCDFAIAVRKDIPGQRFADLIINELDLRREQHDARLRSVYLGGGTPSLLPAGDLARLLARTFESWPCAEELEVTLEANPDDVTEASVSEWLAMGVNRVSLGVQSLQPQTLNWMHRTHTVEDTQRALDILVRASIPSLSVDVIFGLPEDAAGNPVGDVVRLAQSAAVPHFSCYGLTVEPGTPLAKWSDLGKQVIADESQYAIEFRRIHDLLTNLGYDHYEVSSYARSDHRSLHNSGYWTDAAYLGVGPAAHSFDGVQRWWNVRNWAEYERMVVSGGDPRESSERLDIPSRWIERLYLGLRTSDGVDEAVARFLPPPSLDRLEQEGLLSRKGTRIRATAEGWLRLDEIVSVLATSNEGG